MSKCPVSVERKQPRSLVIHNMQTSSLPDMTNASASQLGNEAMQALNSPDVTNAQNAVNTATTAYNTQQTDQATLPQLLENSLTSNLDNPNDPNRQQTQSDLSDLLTTLQNPSGAISDAESAVPGAILSPGAQNEAIARKVGNAGARLSMDNMILGARGAGITGLVGMFGNVMATRTQQLLNAVQQAQNNRDAIWQKAQALGSMAMNFSQLKNQMDEFNKNFGLQEGELTGTYNGKPTLSAQQMQFEQGHNPTVLAQQAQADMAKDAKNMNVHDFISKYIGDPRVPGTTAALAYTWYQKYGGKGKPTQQDYNEFTDLNAGNPGDKAKANLMNLVAYPGAAVDLGKNIVGSAANDIIPQGVMKLVGPAASAGEEAVGGIGGIADLLPLLFGF